MPGSKLVHEGVCTYLVWLTRPTAAFQVQVQVQTASLVWSPLNILAYSPNELEKTYSHDYSQK
jgi:hypothetical protein